MSEGLNLLIVGRNGNGKTSIADTIKHLTEGELVPHDTEDIGDPINNLKCSVKHLRHKAENYVSNCNELGGVHAVLFVVKYGVRFTKQEIDAVSMVKSLLPGYTFKDNVVLVFTYGDNFYEDHKDRSQNFVEWCRAQSGSIAELFQEVNNRYILLDNNSKDRPQNREQINYLREMVEGIRSVSIQEEENGCFTGIFHRNRKRRGL